MIKEENALQILKGLNDDMYSNVRGKILVLNSLLSLEKMFNMVHRDEHHKNLMLAEMIELRPWFPSRWQGRQRRSDLTRVCASIVQIWPRGSWVL